jgi:hypothetical protein
MGGVIRFLRLLIMTPDAMGGRASAVNSIFIGASARWASWKAASPPAWFGTLITAVLVAGIDTILVALIRRCSEPRRRTC